jgi:hypothetical protein
VQQPVFDFNEYKKMEPAAADELWFGLATRFDFPPLLVEDSSADPTTQPSPLGPDGRGVSGPGDSNESEVYRLKVVIVALCVFFGLFIGVAVYLGCKSRRRRPEVVVDGGGDNPMGQYGTF